MKLVLRETIDHLGEIGDIVDVATGYGRNFLIPQGKAVPVTCRPSRLQSRRGR